MNVKLVRLFGWFGVFTPVLGFSMIFLAISTAPWFSWQGNALSDLGVEGLTAAIFNGGLVMTGSVMAVFSLSVYEFGKEDRLGKAGFALLLLACILLMGIGVYPETAGRIHLQVSVAFFVTLPVAIIVNSVYLMRRGNRELGALGIAAGAVAIAIWTLPWDGVAIPEAVSAASAGVWSTATGFWLARYVEEYRIDDLTE
ncbi:DUF998 domain-containing protein [Candidatus Bathyarchaeota archaeon]|nr:DUF998 domain-containing protein [Candidatus Bathyarchaeota archaeon]